VEVSVLITNHDYGRFLARAIDSALDQHGARIQVVVVDDGSTDDSRQVLRSYEGRTTTVLQDQAGQAAALNAAFRASRGDVVCLLDADDWFAPGKVAAVVGALRRRPAALAVHHQMQSVDADGRPIWSPWPRHVWDGDIRAVLRRAGGWFPHATCSALTFRRAYLERLFPLPVGARRGTGPLGPAEVELEPDTYLIGPAAFLAPIAGIGRPLSFGRIHGANKVASRAQATATSLNRGIVRSSMELSMLVDVLEERFGQHAAMRLDDHLEYQLQRRALGRITALQASARTIRSPALPASMRLRETARVLLGIGMSSRVRSPDGGR
jgi:CTP:molybdopterin cytidylyltransferase MocA